VGQEQVGVEIEDFEEIAEEYWENEWIMDQY